MDRHGHLLQHNRYLMWLTSLQVGRCQASRDREPYFSLGHIYLYNHVFGGRTNDKIAAVQAGWCHDCQHLQKAGPLKRHFEAAYDRELV